MISIFTDGACRGNPGPGGYGVILRYGNHYKELSAGYRRTTNNRMELLAVITGLEALKHSSIPVTVYSDSKYVLDSIQKGWLNGWMKNNFKGKKNKDLWLRYHRVAQSFNLSFVWVKGHAGHPENERCDELAVAAATGENLLKDEGFESDSLALEL